MKKDVIAMVGAGQGGRAILSTLVKIPDIEVRYVCDTNPEALGIILAKQHDITCLYSDWEDCIADNDEIDLIFEVTGVRSVLNRINEIKAKDTILIGAMGTKIIFTLLESQVTIAQRLREYKKTLELRMIERTEDLEKANRELEQKILEHERLNEKLQIINDEKTKYLLQATHQLKAPFAAIQSYADLILSGYTGEVTEQTRNVMEKIQARCDLLSTSIKNMLELANLKSCLEDNLKMKPENINEIVEAVVDSSVILAAKRNIAINFEPANGDLTVRCNRDQLTILFSILIENAINYSSNDSAIDVITGGSAPDMFSVMVKDHGIGISQENIPKIFNEYFRTNEAVRQHENGTGLGLAIVKQISTLHNFNIKVDSEPKKGSAFIISGDTVFSHSEYMP